MNILCNKNIVASLCRSWYLSFDITLVLLIFDFLSDMHLSDFLCASLEQCNIVGLRERKKVLQLVNLICKTWQFCGKMLQISLCLWQTFHIFVAKFGNIWVIKWQFSAMLEQNLKMPGCSGRWGGGVGGGGVGNNATCEKLKIHTSTA